EPLIELLSAPPSFSLPPAAQGHTRHYMPIANANTSKVFDTFVVIPRTKCIRIYWEDVSLDESQATLLADMLSSISYLGRAESWVEATLLQGCELTPNTTPLNGHPLQHDQELA